MTNPSTKPFLALLPLLCLAMPAVAIDYETWCNDRFGFCVEHPAALGAEPAPDNGDGREFYDRDGFRMTVSGSNNVLNATVASEMQSQAATFDTVTYRKQGGNWYALSGYQGDAILYVKGFVGAQSMNTLYLRYPRALKTDYDAIVGHIVKTFTPGALDDGH